MQERKPIKLNEKQSSEFKKFLDKVSSLEVNGKTILKLTALGALLSFSPTIWRMGNCLVAGEKIKVSFNTSNSPIFQWRKVLPGEKCYQFLDDEVGEIIGVHFAKNKNNVIDGVFVEVNTDYDPKTPEFVAFIEKPVPEQVKIIKSAKNKWVSLNDLSSFTNGLWSNEKS